MGTARGLLMLSLRPRPRLILTTDTDTVLDTLDTILDTLDTIDSDTMVVSDTTARGLLMLRPIPMFTTDTDSDTAMDTCTARGLLMLSLRLRPIPTFSTVASDTPDTDSDTAPDTTTASRLHQDLSVNQLGQKWIVISLNFPSPVLQFQCYHTKSLVMVSRKQENQW